MKLTTEQQYDIARHVSTTFSAYDDRLTPRKERMSDIFEELNTFKTVSKDKWTPNFKVNKAHEIVNKVVAKIMAGSPNWIVDSNYYNIEEEGEKKKAEEAALGIKEFLNKVYTQQDVIETAEIIAKSMAGYGLGWSKMSFKYKFSRSKSKKEETIIDPESMQEYSDVVETVDEDIAQEYPCIESKSWTDLYFDPRFTRLEDMPAIIEINRNIRLSYFTKNKSKFINVDELVQCCQAYSNTKGDVNTYRSQIEAILGIGGIDTPSKFDMSSLNVKCYYGWYDMSNKDDASEEKLYEFWVVNDLIVVYADEITHIPFEDCRCMFDTESFLPVGVVEPMLGLQREMNFKKNSAAKYINQSLTRQMVWSPQSGINPATINDPVIIASQGGLKAQENFYELPHRQLPSDYFNDLQDQERQIQAMTFTVDTANTKSTGALTNTATGAKIDYAESNIVMERIKAHFESWFVRSAYKLLQVAYDKMEGTITIKKSDGKGFIYINKELFKDALKKFNIKVEVGSTSWDNKQSKRDDAATMTNMAMSYAQAGVPVDLEYFAKQNFSLFDAIDQNKVIKKDLGIPGMGMPGQMLPGQTPI